MIGVFRAGLAAAAAATFAPSGPVSVALWVLLAAVAWPRASRRWALPAGLLAGAVALGAEGGSPHEVMSHHRWLTASLLVWLGAAPDDRDVRWLTAAQLSVVYGFAALDKLEPAWWTGVRLAQIALDADPASPLLDLGYGPLRALAWTVPPLQLFLALAPWHPRLVGPSFVVAALFHGALQLWLDVGTFGAVVAVATLAWLPWGEGGVRGALQTGYRSRL